VDHVEAGLRFIDDGTFQRMLQAAVDGCTEKDSKEAKKRFNQTIKKIFCRIITDCHA